jgi:hypothetical protein
MTVWERAPEVVWRRSGDRRILMGPSSEDVLVIEGTGGPIWDALEQPAAADDLVADLSDRFGVRAEDVRAELASFLAELRSVGLVASR